MMLIPLGVVAGSPARERASAVLAGMHVQKLSLEIGPRPTGTMRETAAADYVADTLEGYGYTVTRVPFSRETADGVSVSENVIAVAPSAKPDSKLILIGASLDTYGMDSTGADHNGSGLAAMLESARLLSGRLIGRSQVAFVAFGSNEMGRAGSKAFTEGTAAGPIDPRNVAIMINIDAVGRGDSVRLIPWGGPRALAPKAFERLVDAVADSTGKPVGFDTTIAMMPQVHTDHSPFLVAGVPAVTITTARSLPYYSGNSLDPYLDVAAEVSGARVAMAADAVVAAADWAASAYRIGKPTGTYISLRVFGDIISVSYITSVIVAAAAVVIGIACIAYSNSMLYDELSRVRSAGTVKAVGMALAVYAVMTVVLWTAFLPSVVVEAVRGVERPWTAYPAPYILAGAVWALFFAILILSLTGTGVREPLRAPMLRLAMIIQTALVCLSVPILRAGSFPFSLGLIFTSLALLFPEGTARKIFACLAPVPVVWLGCKAVVGVGNRIIADLLLVPIFLCLLVAALALPYAIAILVLATEPRGRRGTFYSPGNLFYDIAPGTTLREYRVAPGSVPESRKRRPSARKTFMWILGVLALILTASLFLYPSYNSRRPQPVLVTHVVDGLGGHSLVFESNDNIKGISVVSRSGERGPEKIDARSTSHLIPYSFSAPRLSLVAEMDGPALWVRLLSSAPIRSVKICIVGPQGMAVLSSNRRCLIEEDGDMVRISTVLSGEEPIEAQFQLAFPPDAPLSVEATGSFWENPAPIIISGDGKRFYETNQFVVATPLTAK